MTKISKNSFDLIKSAVLKLKGKMKQAFLATLIMVSPLMLCCFTVYGIVAAAMLWAVFQVGYIRYMRALINDENPSYTLIFSEFSEPWLEIFLGSILISSYLVGLVLLAIPGILLIGFFSMSLFFSEYKKAKTPIEAMKYSAKYTRGNITNMFAFKVIFWALYLVVLGLGIFGVLGVVKLWANYKVLAIIILVLLYVLVTLVWSVITMYSHATSQLFFKELLFYADEDNDKTEEKEVNIIQEQPIEQPVEKKEVVEKTPAKTTTKTTTKRATTTSSTTKKSPAKSTVTKSTATKKTSATKSSTTKKTTAKKITTNQK